MTIDNAVERTIAGAAGDLVAAIRGRHVVAWRGRWGCLTVIDVHEAAAGAEAFRRTGIVTQSAT
ncbi:hypothetical protein BMW24_008575 [Mycobacterium heckeshornense]|nr:hypothetical protein [Mycobacterium heckeshornense]KMV20950.1 hypothetical protein ACT16_19245 [Mycobacterium heckeshornense]MCV7036225.1 hypothetical protein [Mycobacterium heckeshornense]PIJ35813.1 hypothetical protein BMW24_008575 [Mycobacterium heckeshornense]